MSEQKPVANEQTTICPHCGTSVAGKPGHSCIVTAPDRDWADEQAVEFRLRDHDQCPHVELLEPYQCPECIAAALRAAAEEGERRGREQLKPLIEDVEMDRDMNKAWRERLIVAIDALIEVRRNG